MQTHNWKIEMMAVLLFNRTKHTFSIDLLQKNKKTKKLKMTPDHYLRGQRLYVVMLLASKLNVCKDSFITNVTDEATEPQVEHRRSKPRL